MEIWKDVKGYEGIYQVSSLGRVKSLKKKDPIILKPSDNSCGYLRLNLCKHGRIKSVTVHKLVAIAFLNHTPNNTMEIVIDHIDNDTYNNKLENLQLISNRENSSKDRKGSSKYVGVSWHKRDEIWRASIQINGETKYIGSFKNEIEAHLAYQKQLKQLF